ncbi:IS3 family transposase [Microbulbifer taiwanensis]|uniref:IS3 family transposase n=1 Tax=Microbulbifer taiwanensis TaxID=986746 RepID=UPI00361D8D4D
MEQYRDDFPLTVMCRLLKVSVSGHYKWEKRPQCASACRRERLEAKVVETYAEFKVRYGAPRVAEELNAVGIKCSVNFVVKIMRLRGIRARNGKGFKYSPPAEAMSNVAENLLSRQFIAEKPNEKWTTDIAYIWVRDRWLYLATVMDLYSRAIVGWALDASMTEQLVTDALKMAFQRR